MQVPLGALGRAKRQLVSDLRSDPYLRYVLVLAAVLAGFWFWHRIPNFATRDEHSRLLDVLVAYGHVISDPSVQSLREGVIWSRVPFGATFYLFGLAVLPVALFAFLTGRLDVFQAFVQPRPTFGFYPSWHATPRWLWTWSLGFVRLFNVVLAVSAVYLTYRIGVAIRDRTTGRVAATLLALTFGFLTIAHEGGEDMPALVCLLLALYLVVRYVQTGERRQFLTASAVGGFAIAFKLTAAPIVLVIGLGHLFRVRRTGGSWRDLVAPKLLVTGGLVGLVAIAVGFPTLLVGGFGDVYARIFGGSMSRMNHVTGPDAPIWWWFLRGYFSALGLPLFVAALAGVTASVAHLRRRADDVAGFALVAALLGVFWLIFSRWHDFRVHHLLPTFPLIALLLAGALSRLTERRPAVARPVIAVLLVTTGLYASVGVAGYAAMPRDQARTWVNDHAAPNATMESYRRNMQDAVVPHWMSINHAYGRETGNETLDPCPEYIQLGYRDLLYLKHGTYYRNNAYRARYVRSLLNGSYDYRIAAEFGPRPPNFVPQRPTPGSVVDLLKLGVVPQTDQYADEQELAANQYTVILERTAQCGPFQSRYPPF